MKEGLEFRKQESLPVLMAMGLNQALRDRLAAEKRHLRQVLRTARPVKRYRFGL